MVISIWRKRRSDTLLGYRNPQAEIVHLLFPVSLIGLTYGREMSYTHGRDITLEGWLVHTSQANVKGTIKEHRNPILESRCKSKRGMDEVGTRSDEPSQTYPAATGFLDIFYEKRVTFKVTLSIGCQVITQPDLSLRSRCTYCNRLPTPDPLNRSGSRCSSGSQRCSP